MTGQRVLVSGMGGELGSRVAVLLESEPWVGALMGLDNDPPRRRLRRAEFHLVQPSDRARIVELVTRFNPHVLVHLAVWEPHSRANPALAERYTAEAATTVIGAVAECKALEHIIVRSGVEVYGRRHGAPTRPDESVTPDPTCDFGRTLLGIERVAQTVGARVGVTVGAVRLAPVIGAHVPSPLGRLLRQPIVPFSALADPPFALLVDSDAGRALAAAATRGLAQPVNVVSPGAVTALQALIHGRRLPMPLIGPEWWVARRLSALSGAPIPEHVHEMFHRGRLADNGRMEELLGMTTEYTTYEAIDLLYAWETIVRVPPSGGLMAGIASNVLRFPGTRRVSEAVSGPIRQLLPLHAVDDWGRDPRFVRQVQRVGHLRWTVSVDGDQHLPRRAGALLVASSRRFSLSAVFAALALGEAVDRPVRFVGRPDFAPFGDLLRRAGALLARPDEIEGALRHGELVLITARPTGDARHAGTIDDALIAPAVHSAVPVFPVATLSSPASRSARVRVGPAVRPSKQRRGPLAEIELAETTQRSIQRLLDGLGLMPSGLPVADLISRN